MPSLDDAGWSKPTFIIKTAGEIAGEFARATTPALLADCILRYGGDEETWRTIPPAQQFGVVNL